MSSTGLKNPLYLEFTTPNASGFIPVNSRKNPGSTQEPDSSRTFPFSKAAIARVLLQPTQFADAGSVGDRLDITDPGKEFRIHPQSRPYRSRVFFSASTDAGYGQIPSVVWLFAPDDCHPRLFRDDAPF